MSEEFVIKTSVGNTILYLLGCLVFVILGVFLLFSSSNLVLNIVAIVAIAFFGLRFFVLLFRTFDRRPRILIDKNGIEDRLLGVGKINWNDIKYVDLRIVNENDAILLKLKNPEKYLRNRSKIPRFLSRFDGDLLDFGILYINLAGIDAELNEIYEKIMRYASEKQLQNDESLYEDLDRRLEIQ